MNDPRAQATFKPSGYYNLCIFIIIQDYYELPKRTLRTNGKNCQFFEANKFRDVQILYQDKGSMDMTFNAFK